MFRLLLAGNTLYCDSFAHSRRRAARPIIPQVIPIVQTKEKQTVKIKTWPWILGALACLLIAVFIPAVQSSILAYDDQITRWFNRLLGHNRSFDVLVGGLNSKAGDLIVVLCFLIFFLIHSCYNWNQRDVCEKLAFWAWVSVLFIVLYQGQRVFEAAFDRDSPGKVIEGWFNIKQVYGIKVKYSNTHSYPSGHSMAYYFVAFMALRRSLRTGAILLVVALVVPTTRIMTGAHWASDIFLGALPISLFFAALFYETRVRKLRNFFEHILDGIWYIVLTRKRRSLYDRVAAAWTELLSAVPSKQAGK